MTLREIDEVLDVAEREKASLVSLFGLAPIFDRFIAEGRQLEKVEMVAIRVWISWAAVWAVVSLSSPLCSGRLTSFRRFTFLPLLL